MYCAFGSGFEETGARVCNDLTTWSDVLLKKLIVANVVKKLPAFYGIKGSLMNSQKPTSGPYHESVESNSNPYTFFP
jgi:hypothetical protein